MSESVFDLVWDANADALDALLSRQPALANQRHELQAYLPLHEAAEMDAAPVAEVLIRHGADVNARAYGLETPLHRAALNGSLVVCTLLVAKGADIDALNERWVRPLALARFSGADFAKDCAAVLEAAGARKDLLSLAYGTSDELISAHLRSGLDEVDQKLLRHIVGELLWAWQREIQELDLRFGSYAAASATVIDSNLPVLDLLLSQGASIDGGGLLHNQTAIFQAIDDSRFGGGRLLEALLARNASLAMTEHRRTPLEYARETGSNEAVSVLLAHGA